MHNFREIIFLSTRAIIANVNPIPPDSWVIRCLADGLDAKDGRKWTTSNLPWKTFYAIFLCNKFMIHLVKISSEV